MPSAVLGELQSKHHQFPSLTDCLNAAWLVQAPFTPLPASFAPWLDALDAGEAAAISLALTRREQEESPLLLLDESAARCVASTLGLTYTGSAGVLLDAKKSGVITEVLP